MPVGLIVTNAVGVLISSIRIFRNKEFLTTGFKRSMCRNGKDLRWFDVLAAYAVAYLRWPRSFRQRENLLRAQMQLDETSVGIGIDLPRKSYDS
jgi:hypothetical protein